MSNALALLRAVTPPTEVNSRGDEIWAWAARLSAITQEAARLSEIDAVLRARPRCGECDHWMKSRECPSERNVNGYNRGPSMNGSACGKFLITHHAADHHNALRDERADIIARLDEAIEREGK